MADENGDIDVDAPIGGGGGYVDDDIDIDDDDDDLVPLSARAGPSTDTPAAKKMRSGRGGALPKRDSPPVNAEYAARDTDLLLRPGSKRGRELILARFLGDMPELATAARVRLYRAREGTIDGRTRGLKSHHDQQAYYNSYVGRQRLDRYARTGHHAVPDRARKGWTLEVTKEGRTPSEPPLPPMRGQQPTYPPEAEIFSGAFDGAHTASRYALMVMGADGRFVDVVPVGDHAWYSFRSLRAGGATTAEEATALMGKISKRGEKRIAKLELRTEAALERRENMMGGYSRFEGKQNVAPVGLRRKVNAKREEENQRAGESFDFEEDFDNDDVLQVDREDAVKEQRSRQPPRDHKKEAELFRKLIKDETRLEKPAASLSQSDSEEDEGTKSPSRSPSPSRPLSQSRAMSPSSQLPPTGPRPLSAAAGSASRNGAAARAPRAPSRASTPQQSEVAHLMPPKGTLPKAQHMTAVLRALTVDRGRRRMKLRDFLGLFERTQQNQKDNIAGLLKVCTQIEVEHVGGKPNYFVSPKP